MNEIIYPVVIVGKDRTRMTCEVARRLNEKLLNCKPYFIVVSDRSRVGHCEAIQGFFQRELPGVKFEVRELETSSDRFGWGAAMNIGLERAFEISDSAILVDNDWILQRTILVNHLAEVLRSTPMGCVSFKAIPKNHDYMVQERIFGNFKFDVRTEKAAGIFRKGRPNYVVEIGCMAISKRFFEKVGRFKENVNHTDDVEYDFISRFSKIPIDAREEENILFGNFTEFRHEQLNGPGHVFTHIGMDSQSGRKQKWGIPEPYIDLNDVKKDEELCAKAERGKVLYATNGRFEVGSPLLPAYRSFVNAADGDVYVVPPRKYGKDAFLDIFKKAIEEEYDYIIYSDADNIIVGKKNLEMLFADFRKHPDCIFGGASDGGLFCHRSHNPSAVNPFLLFARVSLLKKYYDSKSGEFDFKKRETKIGQTQFDVIQDYRKWRDAIGYRNPFAEKISGHIEDVEERKFFGEFQKPWTYSESQMSFEPYYDIFLGLKDGDSIYPFYGSDVTCDGSGMSSSIHWFGVAPHDYDRPEHLVCIHTWLSRFVINRDYSKFGESQYERIQRVMNDATIIDWGKYVDGIYCLHYYPQTSKYKRLVDELKRVNIYGFRGFHLEYNFPSPYDKLIFEKHRDSNFCPKVLYVNVCLAVIRILKTALARGERRILFLENDVAFLKDKSEMIQILDSIPNDADFIQFDKYVSPGTPKEVWDRMAASSDGPFVDMGGEDLTSAACILFNEKAMREMIRILEMKVCATDQVYRFMNCKKYISRKNLCVQLLYRDSNCYDSIGQEDMDTVYSTQGIRYSDYNIPKGYDYGKTVDEAMNSRTIGSKCKGRKKVSVYAIAYNESRNIDKWYSCVSEADEVVVLDTGSTDDTVEKLRKLGAYVEVEKFDKWNSVEEYDAIVARGGNPWRFDKARNDSLKLVAEDSDILVTIDIDEFMQPGWRKNLEDQWIAAEESGKHPTCAAYKYVWCYNPDGTEARTFEIHKIHARGVCHWTHMIHEVLHYDSGERPFWLKDFVVEHHQDLSKTRKSYLPMLAVEARDMPDNDRSAHYYGRELMYEGRWDESIAELKRHLSLRASGWRAERAASMRYIANCYAGKRDSEMEEFWLWKAAMEDPNHREASFRLGEIYMSRKDWRSAERAWELCLNIKNRSQEYISDNRCWSAIPHLKYSQALWWDGNWRAACEQAEIAVQMEPSNKEAIAQRDGMQATRKQHNR